MVALSHQHPELPRVEGHQNRDERQNLVAEHRIRDVRQHREGLRDWCGLGALGGGHRQDHPGAWVCRSRDRWAHDRQNPEARRAGHDQRLAVHVE